MAQATILLADDEATLRKNLAQVLAEEGFEVIVCPDGTEALRALKNNAVDGLITDLRMPGVSGMDLIDYVSEHSPETGIIVITAFGEVETAVEAMKKGASEYICKPLIFDEVIFKLKQMLAHNDIARENIVLREQVVRKYDYKDIVAGSPAMAAVLETVKRISRTTSNVLFQGESGTGKEVLARALHFNGVSQNKPFVAVNCGGLTDSLVESQLFGYRRGAFTGATTDRAGFFETANGGSLFLDEIGNLSLSGQAVLLRAIEEKAITRVGDTRSRKVNLRIIAATNQDLESAVKKGEFRQDLFYRLNVIHALLPPLRERPEDIPAFVDCFVKKYNEELKCNCPGISSEALEAMFMHTWPGNVRELENTIERALIFAEDRQVELHDLPISISAGPNSSTDISDLRSAGREFERRHIIKMLARFENNKAAAAEALGIGLSSLYRKMEDLKIARENR